jgi:hypothetical protein
MSALAMAQTSAIFVGDTDLKGEYTVTIDAWMGEPSDTTRIGWERVHISTENGPFAFELEQVTRFFFIRFQAENTVKYAYIVEPIQSPGTYDFEVIHFKKKTSLLFYTRDTRRNTMTDIIIENTDHTP